MESFAGKHVLVLGLGLHGGALGNIRWLASQGARITVSDIKTKEQLDATLQKLSNIPDISYIFGTQDNINISDVDFFLRNPAVPRTAAIIVKAREQHIPILMDSSIFFDQCDRNRIIGITGSKGKTTTSHAIFSVLRKIIPDTVAVGIDGVSPLGELTAIKSTKAPIVFELSSWRLEALQEAHVSPHIAVCTSIYKDHLNTYSSYEEYIEVKKQIIADQTQDDIAILNYNDAIIRTWNKDVQGTLYWYSLEQLPDTEEGIWINKEQVIVRIHGEEKKVCSVSDIPHTSPHELRNKLPAILIALLYEAELEKILQAVQEIPLLKHRMQMVREINGVQYINDTTATMPDATIAALQSLRDKPTVLILGGSDKALEFQNLANTIAHAAIRHLIWLPGTATKRMQEEILPYTQALSHDIKTMDEAVVLSHTLAHTGDIVLLSPAATSFGLFTHEFDRGDTFVRAVDSL